MIACALVALTGAGCGPPPPQAPLAYAKKLDESTSGISSACGEAYQLSAFPPAPRRLMATLEATASADATKLAGVLHRDPAWIYQGETVRQIVGDALSMLDSCGLHGARRALARASGSR